MSQWGPQSSLGMSQLVEKLASAVDSEWDLPSGAEGLQVLWELSCLEPGQLFRKQSFLWKEKVKGAKGLNGSSEVAPGGWKSVGLGSSPSCAQH